MVTLYDRQSILEGSSSNKKVEEEAALQRLIDKKSQEKLQEQKQQEKIFQEALRTQKSVDAKKYEVTKSKFESQFNVLEQISKQLNVKVRDLNPTLINQVINSLDDAKKDIAQNILKQNQLQSLKQEHQNNQLKIKGIEQQFSKEMQVMETISKALRVPISQLVSGNLQKIIQTLKKASSEDVSSQAKIAQLAKELGIAKEQINVKDVQKLLELFRKQDFAPKQQIKDARGQQSESNLNIKLEKLEARQQEIQKILESLKGKQEEVLNKIRLNDSESKNVFEKQINKVNQKVGQLEYEIQQLNKLIKNTLNQNKKTELEGRKQELQGQVKELKSSLQSIRGKAGFITENDEQAQNTEKEVVIKGRLQELNKTIKQLENNQAKTTNESIKGQIKESIDQIKQEKEVLEKNFDKNAGKEMFLNEKKNLNKNKPNFDRMIIKDFVLKNLTNKLDKMESELRLKEVFEKEINNQSSKEIKEKLSEVKSALKDIQTVKEGLKQLKTIGESAKPFVLKQLFKNIKNLQFQEKLDSFMKQGVKAFSVLEEIALGEKKALTDSEVSLLKSMDVEDLGEQQLNNILKAITNKINQLKISMQTIEDFNKTIQEDKTELQEQRAELVNSLKTVLSNKAKGILGANEIKGLFNANAFGQEAAEQLMKQFDYLQSSEAEVQFVLLLRDLFNKDINVLKMLLSILVKEGKVSEEFIEEELGIIFTKEKHYEGEVVSKEALEVLSKLTKLNPETIAGNAFLQQMVAKGKIDREIFERLFKKKVSKDAWDYGVVAFSKNKMGILKQRVSINSLKEFWGLMQRFSKEEEDVLEIAELFLTSSKFTNYQMELVSFFIVHFQENFIDPDFHLFDLYKKYMNGNIYAQLKEEVREELTIAVLIRMINSFEGTEKHKQLARLVEMSQQKQDSREFIRSVEVFEFYFSHGGIIKEDFLDINKELKVFDNITEWEDDMQSGVDKGTISKLVSEYSKPAKKLERVNLGRLSDRLKKK